MMKRLHVLSGLLMVFALTVGCSNQWREADPEIDGDGVLDLLNEIEVSADAGGAMSSFMQLKNDKRSTIFFADAPGSLGPVISVSSLLDYSFMGPQGADLWYDNIEVVRVFFIDLPAAEGHQAGLLVDIKKKGGSFFAQAFVSQEAPSITDHEYSVRVSNGTTQLMLRSFDVFEGGLAGVIQLKVNDFDSAGNEQILGKFSTLVGFGP